MSVPTNEMFVSACWGFLTDPDLSRLMRVGELAGLAVVARSAMPLQVVIDAVRTVGGERGEALFVAKIAEDMTPRELAAGDAELEARLVDALDLARGSLHLH